MEVANVMVTFYPRLSRDLVLAGIFLHEQCLACSICQVMRFSIVAFLGMR